MYLISVWINDVELIACRASGAVGTTDSDGGISRELVVVSEKGNELPRTLRVQYQL